MLENVFVTSNGQPFMRWTRIAVQASVKDAARSLTLTAPDTVGAPTIPAIFPKGADVVVTTGGETIFTGWMDKLSPHLAGQAYEVTICARAKGADFCDCSVDHTKPDYVKKHVLDVANDQDQFGVGVSCDFKPDGFDRWRPNVGDTCFHALRPLCEDEGATMCGQPDGSIKITRAGETAKPQTGYLMEGRDFNSGSGHFDDSATHSKIKVHGQSYSGSGKQSLEIVGEAANDKIPRYRPHVEHHDRQTDLPRAKRRAKRRRDKECGEGIRVEVVVNGWRDTGGGLWTPGKTIFVMSPSLYVEQTLLIESVEYMQGGSEGEGTMAHLCLVDPRAHGGKGGGINKSGGAWSFDESAAS